MLGEKNVAATLAVKDLAAAAKFYEETVGLTRVGGHSPDEEAILYRSGDSAVLVYRSELAGTNQATAASWAVGDEIEAVVAELGSKGVSFEHYDLPGTTLAGDIHVQGDLKVAWFKDPDGNILNLVNQSQM
jgi:catechol 2,3-dioxygenase-like lactoylglutathione lyase family enzyme